MNIAAVIYKIFYENGRDRSLDTPDRVHPTRTPFFPIWNLFLFFAAVGVADAAGVPGTTAGTPFIRQPSSPTSKAAIFFTKSLPFFSFCYCVSSKGQQWCWGQRCGAFSVAPSSPRDRFVPPTSHMHPAFPRPSTNRRFPDSVLLSAARRIMLQRRGCRLLGVGRFIA